MPYLPPPTVMNPWCAEASGNIYTKFANALTSTASAVWPTASLALFFPFQLFEPALATKMVVYNGAAVSGNVDAGIYDRVGTRLASSGSVAQAGINGTQELDFTDVVIGPGVFYMALVLDNITGTFFRGASAGTSSMAYTMASAFALPATATFASYSISSYVPVFGVLLNKTLI